VITGNRFILRSVLLAILPYVLVLLSCAYSEASHLPLFGAQSEKGTAVTSQTPSADGDEELCGFMHEQLFAKQAFSVSPIRVPKISHVVPIGKAMLRPITDLDGFRPPGPWLLSAENLTSPLYSVLRI
jgi:hypothetical protein